MFSLIGAWINGLVNNGEAGDLRRHRAHYDVIVMGIRAPEPQAVPVWTIEMEQSIKLWAKVDNHSHLLIVVTPYGDKDLGQYWLM